MSRLLAALTCLLFACGLRSDTTPAGTAPEPRPTPRRDVTRATRDKEASRHAGPRQGGGALDADEGRTARERGAPRRNRVLVTRVVDGDTIEVRRGGILAVRLIGIDTPETVHPSEPAQCFGPAASSRTKEALEGDVVRLEFDVERKDHYGRVLAYVWDDGRLFNKVLVERGFATVSTYPPNDKYVERLTAAQRTARRADRGLWGVCSRAAAHSGFPAATGPSIDGGRSHDRGCAPAYAGACIPPPPPDLDCSDVPVGFRSVGADPHGFDGDDDGVACE